MPIFIKPVSFIHNNKTYRVISRYPQFAITELGDIINTETFEHIRTGYFKNNYLTVYITNIINKTKQQFVHRLIAIGWCENDDYVKYNMVDHKNGNTKDCYKDNLQWTSNGRNSSKIHNNNIIKDILVRNIFTGEIKELHTMTEVCKYIVRGKINTVRTPLKQGRVWSTISGDYEIYYKKDFKKWTYKNNPDESKRIHVSYVNSNKKIYFNNLLEVAKYFKITDTKIGLKNIEKSLNNLIIIKDTRPIPFAHLKEAKNVITKEIIQTTSTKELIEKTDLTKSTIIKYLKLGVDNRISNNWLLRYKSNNKWADDLNKIDIPNNRAFKTYLINANDKITFDSIAKLGNFLNVDNKTLWNYYRKKKTKVKVNNEEYRVIIKVPLRSDS